MTHPQSLGTDFDAVDDITYDWAMAPDERTAFAQALYRRLRTSRGALCRPPDAASNPTSQTYGRDYGGNVMRFLLESGLTSDQMALEIEAELLKDERVRLVRVLIEDTRFRISVSSHQAPSYFHTLTIDRVTGEIALGAV